MTPEQFDALEVGDTICYNPGRRHISYWTVIASEKYYKVCAQLYAPESNYYQIPYASNQHHGRGFFAKMSQKI